jgi:hypothetical protein
MAKRDDVEVEVSPADFACVERESHCIPATETTPAITKLELVKYTIAVSEPLLRVLLQRPTALERWPNGVHPGMHLGRGADDGGFYQKRMIRAAPDYVEGVEITFPSGRTAREVCPTEPAVLAWCTQMGAARESLSTTTRIVGTDRSPQPGHPGRCPGRPSRHRWPGQSSSELQIPVNSMCRLCQNVFQTGVTLGRVSTMSITRSISCWSCGTRIRSR